MQGTRLAHGQPMIRLADVHKWYGEFHVLKAINLEVDKGQKVVVCGPSGSGKSTMIRCINRLEEHQQGQIIVDGTELTNDLKNIDKVRSEVGMVFQHFNLFPHLTILENLVLAPMWVRHVPRKEAEERASSRRRAPPPPGAASSFQDSTSRALAAFRGFLARGPVVGPALLEELIQIGHVCRCGLIAQNASVLWIDGRVVRMRKLPNSLLELGISFLRRAQASELPPINPGNPGIMKKGSTAE